MAFVVDGGLGLSNSNAYMSVAEFKSYHDDRGQSYGSFSDSQIEKAIVKASDYLDIRFTFVGYRLNQVQSMQWPRLNAYYPDGRIANGIPDEIKESCAEYALRALSSVLAPDPSIDPSGRPVLSDHSIVGPIESDKTFGGGGFSLTFKPYPIADQRLKDLAYGGTRVMRA